MTASKERVTSMCWTSVKTLSCIKSFLLITYKRYTERTFSYKSCCYFLVIEKKLIKIVYTTAHVYFQRLYS